MAWTETNPNTFQKSFSNHELVYYKMSKAFAHIGKDHWSIHLVIRLASTHFTLQGDLAKLLKAAWISLLYQYPGLSVYPDGERKIFNTLTAAVVENWANETFIIDTATIPDSIISNAPPYALPRLVYFPSTFELLFLSQHWRHDGLGALMLIDRLLTLLVSPKATSQSPPDTAQISPPVEDAAGCPPHLSPELQHYSKKYIEAFHARAVNTGGFSYLGSPTTKPGPTSHAEFTFSAPQTSSIVAACKSRSINVPSAIHASLAHTYFTHSTNSITDPTTPPPESYTTVIATNMRPYLPTPYNSPAHACATYVASITPSVLRSDDFSTQTKKLSDEYRGWYSRKFAECMREIYRIHVEKLMAPRAPDAKPPAGCTFSSLGVVEKHLKGVYRGRGVEGDGDGGKEVLVEIDRMRFGVSMMTRQMLLYAWTFRGELVLSVDFNEAYYERTFVEEMLGTIAGVLVKELEIEKGIV